MPRKRSPETYSTPDITLGSFLKAHKVELLGVRREGTRTFFLFKGGPRTEELVSEYFANGLVSIGDFRRAWHDLKNIIFSPEAEGTG